MPLVRPQTPKAETLESALALYHAIVAFKQDHGKMPTYRELVDLMGYTSLDMLRQRLAILVDRGLLDPPTPRVPRSLRLGRIPLADELERLQRELLFLADRIRMERPPDLRHPLLVGGTLESMAGVLAHIAHDELGGSHAADSDHVAGHGTEAPAGRDPRPTPPHRAVPRHRRRLAHRPRGLG